MYRSNLMESLQVKLKESDSFDRFAKDLETALIDEGFKVYTQDYRLFNVSEGDAGMHIILYSEDDIDSPFEGQDSIGLGGDTSHKITVLPLYPDSSWDWEMATPQNNQPKVGEEAYSIFKELSKTSVDEVVDIVRNSFDNKDNTESEEDVLGFDKEKELERLHQNESNLNEDEVQEEPKTEEKTIYDKFLDYTIDVYDVDAFIQSETDGQQESFSYSGGAAIMLGMGGKGCISDYEAIYNYFDSTDEELKIPANDISVEKDGKRTIYLLPKYLIKTSVQEIIEKAPKKEMKAADFFYKHDYNGRCESNYYGLVKYLQEIGFFNQNESSIKESAEDIEAFWNKGFNVGDKVESSGAGEVEILALDKNADYILVKREASYQPFVAAWAPQFYNDKLSWGQGHYFENEEDARDYFNEKTGKLVEGFDMSNEEDYKKPFQILADKCGIDSWEKVKKVVDILNENDFLVDSFYVADLYYALSDEGSKEE